MHGAFCFMNNDKVLSKDQGAERSLETSGFYSNNLKPTISTLQQSFLDYSQFEKSFSPETIAKYNDCLRSFIKTVGDVPIDKIQIDHFIQLKRKLAHRGVGEARVAGIVFAMKSFLRYCKEVQEIECLDSSKIKSPKKPKREVVYLTNEEVDLFINSIKIYCKWDGNKRKKKINIQGLRFRTLVEVLLGTGMRISEALSLDISDIDFKESEAVIIGKGDKQRTVYFSKQGPMVDKEILRS